MNSLVQDIRYGLRLLKKNFGFTTITVLVLALGIGAISAIFSVTNAVIIRPLPYKNSDRLAVIWETQPKLAKSPTSAADYMDWKSQSQSFDELAAYSAQNLNLVNKDEPERLDGAVVSTNFFQVFNVTPILGQTFTPDAEQTGSRVAVISEGLWKRRFGTDKSVIGADLTLNDIPFKVVGVMPQTFRFPEQADIWVSPKGIVPEPPIVLPGDILKMRQVHYLGVIGRLKPGITLDTAKEEMKAIASNLQREYPTTNEGHGVSLVSLNEEVVGNVKPALIAFLSAIGFVLLIVCSNVANLLLGRAIARQKEFSIRMALGASRSRLIRQLLTESVLISLIAGGLGLLLAQWGIKLLLTISPSNIPRLNEVNIDATALVVTLSIALLTGIGFGLAPALQTLKTDITVSLKEEGRGSSGGPTRHRLRNILIVSEVALSLVLLSGAGLMLRSFYNLKQIDFGFSTGNVLTMQISLPRTKYSEPRQVIAFYGDVLERIKSQPGVLFVGAVNRLPLTGTGLSGGFVIQDRPSTPGNDPMAERRMVNPDYFRAMGIPLKTGRFFSDIDINGPGVVLINEAAAKRYWGDEDPLGKHISIESNTTKWLEIIGVVGDVRGSDLYTDPKPEIYLPYFQTPWNNMTIVAKLASGAPDITTAFRNAVMEVDKNQPVYNIQTLDQIIDDSISRPRFNATLISIFASVALVLAAVGLYGVMAAAVTQRRHEIGIRMALGGQPSDILKMIVRQGMALVSVGVAAGICLALVLMRSISSLLFQVPAADLITYLAVSIFLMLVTAIAIIVPAYRATKVSPMFALRQE